MWLSLQSQRRATMEGRMLEVSTLSLLTLHAHFRSSSMSTGGLLNRVGVLPFLIQLKSQVIVRWMQPPSSYGADHEFRSFTQTALIIRHRTRLRMKMSFWLLKTLSSSMSGLILLAPYNYIRQLLIIPLLCRWGIWGQRWNCTARQRRELWTLPSPVDLN